MPGEAGGAGTFAALLMGIFAGLGVFLMIFAWVIRSQRVYEFGLLFAFGGWVARAVGIALDGQVPYSLLPVSFALMAGGAYVLETMDERKPARQRAAVMWRAAPR